MPSRIEMAERETARVTTSRRRARRAERELISLWSAFRSSPLAGALWPNGDVPTEPMPVLVDLARSGVPMLFDTARGIRASPECVKALIHADDDPPVEPKYPPESKVSEPVEPQRNGSCRRSTRPTLSKRRFGALRPLDSGLELDTLRRIPVRLGLCLVAVRPRSPPMPGPAARPFTLFRSSDQAPSQGRRREVRFPLRLLPPRRVDTSSGPNRR
jgi:hypothetical protein